MNGKQQTMEIHFKINKQEVNEQSNIMIEK